MNQILYCKETGEELVDQRCGGHIPEEYKCLIHGWQAKDHFDIETNNIKSCAVCMDVFYCEDNIRKTCSVLCASRWNK
jgi:hypothetical protein